MERIFASREEASVEAAHEIARRLTARLNESRAASVVVTGGTTPARCYEELAEIALDWTRVHVLLSDERWVAPDDEASNERLVRNELLRNHAAAARLLPMYDASSTIEDRCAEIDGRIRLLPFPFACALLGMGDDGHFASLFPDAANLDDGLDVNCQRLCLPVTTVASPFARVSLTLSALARSDEIVLLIFGDAKRDVYEQARKPGSKLPVAQLLKQKQAPVRVYWAP